ncbi:UBX domain-containing protein 4 isoform X3 [Lethenteron reissneri]|uniref:UBX domain-containing protein 4 isoform X3 n=1 Tax=Lethenteron reissneri TaxID=7753 RepID=UPI002AB6281C|nr:UBX domain-containing protein 4 isoform X3 [Lethenteron reissneri]
MLWFDRTIPAAIAEAKKKTLIFVVFICGDDEESVAMSASWEDPEVTEAAGQACVAIKLQAASEPCMQFSQIYPLSGVPSSYFIGESGVPLEVIRGSLSAQELLAKIAHVKQMHVEKGAVGGAAAVASASAPQPSTSTHVLDGSSDGGTQELMEEHGLPLSEEEKAARVERLNRKLEEKRQQKAKEEEESNIRREVERRKLGKDMTEFKQRKEEEQAKRVMDERNREKAEERAAKDRIRQQIAQDRAERAERYNREKEEVDAARVAAQQAKEAEKRAKEEQTQQDRTAMARIQYRLPDGSYFTNQFASETTLAEARTFAQQVVKNAYGDFTLATAFPRRNFTVDDYPRTLQELGLAPSAAIIVLPGNRTAVAARSPGGTSAFSVDGLFALMGTLLLPIVAVWRFLGNFLFGQPVQHPPAGHISGGGGGATAAAAATAGPRAARDPGSSSAGSGTTDVRGEGAPRRRKPATGTGATGGGGGFKRDGNVYQLGSRGDSDNDDDNNTWNGNSTQQM